LHGRALWCRPAHLADLLLCLLQLSLQHQQLQIRGVALLLLSVQLLPGGLQLLVAQPGGALQCRQERQGISAGCFNSLGSGAACIALYLLQ
jgi:hypothetical protein